MQQSFGHTFKFSLSLSRAWLSLGPGWAALAGAVSTGYPEITLITLLQLVGLWMLVDPILGTLWELAVQQGIWRRVARAQLPSPPRQGFFLPYAQPESMAERLVLLTRRYQAWWRESYQPVFGGEVATFGVGLVLALIIGFVLKPAIFWLVVLAVALTLLAGREDPTLAASGGGRLQSLVQFLLPWLMGSLLWSSWPLLPLILGLCFWTVYLGALRMLGHHHRAEMLFLGGQVTAILVLLALRLLPGAAILSVLLATQLLIKINAAGNPADRLKKSQLYLIIGVLVAGLSLGSWGIG